MEKTAIKRELEETLKTYPKAWIGYNANTRKYSVYIIPISFTNSLFITKI